MVWRGSRSLRKEVFGKKPKGRLKPYSEIGIKRVPCLRCGKPSSSQWQICSLGNRYFGVCRRCDVWLNHIVLGFFFPWEEADRLIKEYK